MPVTEMLTNQRDCVKENHVSFSKGTDAFRLSQKKKLQNRLERKIARRKLFLLNKKRTKINQKLTI